MRITQPALRVTFAAVALAGTIVSSVIARAEETVDNVTRQRAHLLEQVALRLRDSAAFERLVEGTVLRILSAPGTEAGSSGPAAVEVRKNLTAEVRRHLQEPQNLVTVLAPRFAALSDPELGSVLRFMNTAEGGRAVIALLALPADVATESAPRFASSWRDLVAAAAGQAETKARIRAAGREMLLIASVLERSARVPSSSDDAPEALRYPATSTMRELAAIMAKSHGEIPTVDPWQKPYVYVVSPDGEHYRLVSGGADGRIEPGSDTIDLDAPLAPAEAQGADLIIQDGTFLSAPPLVYEEAQVE